MKGIEKQKERIEQIYQLRLWERSHLPISKTTAGYHLFLFLSMSLATNGDVRLKNIYHSLPFSEKTLRLLLRDLEGGGWIKMPKKSSDPRHKDIVPTSKFDDILKSWASQIKSTFD
jgi:DNA-binding HxlR family transcriptional regulator